MTIDSQAKVFEHDPHACIDGACVIAECIEHGALIGVPATRIADTFHHWIILRRRLPAPSVLPAWQNERRYDSKRATATVTCRVLPPNEDRDRAG